MATLQALLFKLLSTSAWFNLAWPLGKANQNCTYTDPNTYCHIAPLSCVVPSLTKQYLSKSRIYLVRSTKHFFYLISPESVALLENSSFLNQYFSLTF